MSLTCAVISVISNYEILIHNYDALTQYFDDLLCHNYEILCENYKILSQNYKILNQNDIIRWNHKILGQICKFAAFINLQMYVELILRY